jgi:hypothetical protein
VQPQEAETTTEWETHVTGFGKGTTHRWHASAAPSRLSNGSGPIADWCDLQFSEREAGTGGPQIGTTQKAFAVRVNNGLLSTKFDFGSGTFQGMGRWPELTGESTGPPPLRSAGSHRR